MTIRIFINFVTKYSNKKCQNLILLHYYISFFFKNKLMFFNKILYCRNKIYHEHIFMVKINLFANFYNLIQKFK